ncbi:lipoyl(octanoyl) transferase LipB [candidate division KSB1 bacterium]|nr:lipoyl(octanoyl) transferase LipB [candidate division KSB1 bacterium]
MQNDECILIESGKQTFPLIDQILLKLVDARIKDQIQDVLLLFSYHACLAVGAKQLDKNDLLKPLEFFTEQGINLYQSVRGGGLTYHWPGQLVCYPVIKLTESERNIPRYMYKLEETGLRTLKDLGIKANRKREKTAQIGLWVGNEKIASIGIRITKWVTSYGIALNVSGDVGTSEFIRPCGLENVKLTTAAELTGKMYPFKEVISIYLQHFQQVFCRRIVNYRTIEE